MSRHTITAKDPEQFTVVVGYDAALETYFGQVIDRKIEREEEERAARIAASEQEEDDDTPERDAAVLWVGTNVGEVPTVAELTQLIEPYAVLTFELARTLHADQRRECTRRPRCSGRCSSLPMSDKTHEPKAKRRLLFVEDLDAQVKELERTNAQLTSTATEPSRRAPRVGGGV